MIHLRWSFALILLSSRIKANTEIVNFKISSNNFLVHSNDNNNFTNSSSLRVNDPRVMSISTGELTQQIYKLDLNYKPRGFISSRWRKFETFLEIEAYTVRLCWPASYPTSFDLSLYSLPKLTIPKSSSSPQDFPRALSLILIISAHSTGIPFPSTTPHLSTPFTLLLEPLYLGFLPSSALPLIIGIIGVLIVMLGTGMIRKVTKFLEKVGREVEREEVLEGKKEK